MIRADYHVHTTFSDGAFSPREMVEAALARGLDAIGFSDHSHTAFDPSWCMACGRAAEYRETVRALADEYCGRIRVLCGVEQDYYSEEPAAEYDYVIGSVHYLRVVEEYVPVDEGSSYLRDAARKYFGGDVYALPELYFKTVADVVRKTGADIIGHFDLIACGNERDPLFDERHPRYVAAWKAAADVLLAAGKPFEINLRAVYRGDRSVPYPTPEIVQYLAKRGAKFVFSGDAHDKAGLAFDFDEWQKRLQLTKNVSENNF